MTADPHRSSVRGNVRAPAVHAVRERTLAHVADTVPYPWPYDGLLDPGRLALVVGRRPAGVAGRRRTAASATGSPSRRSAPLAVAGVPRWCGRATALAAATTAATVAARPSAPPLGAGRRARSRRPRRRRRRHRRLLRQRARRRRCASRGVDQLLCAGFGAEGPSTRPCAAPTTRATSASRSPTPCATFDPDLRRRAPSSSITMSGGIFGAVGTSSACRCAAPSTGAP